MAYTFDAGPNACLYLLEENVPEVIEMINYVFPPKTTSISDYLKGIDLSITTPDEVSST